MIGFFPSPYPDELLYSVLARYFDKSGYTAYTFAAEDLFVSKTVRPDIEFLNQYTSDATMAITRNTTMESIVMGHTMFPYYARFLPLERRQKALQALITMQTNYRNWLAIPKNKSGAARYLRYCPVCADRDRLTYGEAYWHRMHQMLGVNICPLHLCQLIDSGIILSGKSSPALISAEVSVPCSSNVVYSENSIEIVVAQYMGAVFQMDMGMVSDVSAGDFLHSQMEGTKYLSVRGEQRNIAVFQNNFCNYYKDLEGNWFKDRWQFEKLFSNYIHTTYEICLAALFLNIPAADLVSMRLPDKTQEQRFDEAVYQLHEQGLNYPAIAERLNASVNIVKAIGEKRYGTYHKSCKNPLKGGVKPFEWNKMDKATLPRVKAAIKQLQGDGHTRPKKVTVFAVEKILGLPCKRIDNLPQCKAEIQRYYETQQEYWAREVIWAAKGVIANNEPFNWKHLRAKTNMRKRDLAACIPYLNQYGDNSLIQQIKSLL